MQQSALLGRLQTFLPAMQKANQELEQAVAAEPEACNIEHVTEDAPHIEMNLACGVLELKDGSAAAAAQKAVNIPNNEATMQQLPVLEDRDDSNSDPLMGAGVLNMSSIASEPNANLMSERASRRIGSSEQVKQEDCSAAGRSGTAGKSASSAAGVSPRSSVVSTRSKKQSDGGVQADKAAGPRKGAGCAAP